ncbi:MAG: hypothetical protein AB4041_17775 [Microcystaceae cyanobacterium]
MEFTQKTLSSFLTAHFFHLWGTILSLLILYTFIDFFREKNCKFSKIKSIVFNRDLHPLNQFFSINFINKLGNLLRNNRINLFSILLFCIFLFIYGFVIIYKQDFANYDNDILTDSVLKGYSYYPPIWPEVGRFFPLGHQEWHLWELLTNSQDSAWYFAFSLIQLLVIILGLLKLLNFLPLSFRLIIIVLTLTIPSFFQSFDSLTIPERNLMFWLVIFMLAIQAYTKFGHNFYGGISLIAIHFSLFYKEPAVSFFAVFALLRLIYFLYQDRQILKQNAYFLLFKKYHIDLLILTLCSIFLLLYFLINLPYQSLEYAASRAASPQDTFLHYTKSDLLLTIFLIATILRFSLLIISRQVPDLFWDAIALGVLAYFAAYVKLGLINTYYLAPVDLIAILYLSYFIATYVNFTSHWKKGLLLIIGTAILIQNIHQTPKLYLSRLNFIDARVKITEFLINYSQQKSGQLTTLYFPYAESHQLYYLSCFLKHKQLTLADTFPYSKSNKIDYMITSPLKFSDNNSCVTWSQNHHCFHKRSPDSNNLIVILPETELEPQELSKWQQQGTLLFHYHPFPKGNKMHAYIFAKN